MYNAQLLREILDAQLDLVCRFRRDGTIVFVNRAYAESLGKTPAELTGKSLWQFVTTADRADVEARLDLLSPANPEITIENRFETAAGTRWVLWRNHGLRFDAEGRLLEAQSSGMDITDRKALEEQRQMLVAELNHRVRNTLAVVQGMAYQSFRTDGMPSEALEVFNARLHALAAAHTVLSSANWSGAELATIVRQGLAVIGEESSRVSAAGELVSVPPNIAVTMVLVLHELATNALKYGAFSDANGCVAIRWRCSDGRLELTWHEAGGPPVRPPERSGFGSRLLDSSIRRQLAGELELDYAPAGFRCRMAFDVPAPELSIS